MKIKNLNMGGLDRGLRIVVALVVGVLIFADVLHGTLAVVFGILAVVFVLTSFVGTCPLYLPFRLSTKRDA